MMTTVKSAYEASPEVIQPVAGRPECWPAVEEVGDVEVIGGCDTDGCFRLVRCKVLTFLQGAHL
jgi:hypothetical protein